MTEKIKEKEINKNKDFIIKKIESVMNSSEGIFVEGQAEEIAEEICENIENPFEKFYLNEKIENALRERNNIATADLFKNINEISKYQEKDNTTDYPILSLLDETNIDVMDENSNKNPLIASTQRDLIAGEVSKDIAKRKLIPKHLLQAHEDGAIHIHDLDYFIQPIINCCLVNMEDMLDNGTVVNGKMIESPKSFQVACNVMTQIIAQIASNQYGGQSIDISCLSKYLKKSYEKNYKLALDTLDDEEQALKMAKAMTKRNLKSGIQTIQYQLNTLMTSNGQSPFVTIFMWTDEKDPYLQETVLIIEEILKQRIEGIKNESGVYVTPAFPKLIYVLDENNVREDSKFYNLTKLAVKCTAKRMYPDYISAKKMRENYEGNVFSPMGCRAFLPVYHDKKTGKDKFQGRFNIGACTINLPQIGILCQNNEEKFFEVFKKRLNLVKEVGILRYEHLKNVTSDSSPIHFQHGAIARLKPHEKIDKLLKDGYSTVSIGYIGIYEATKLVKGVSHTSDEGRKFAEKIMNIFNEEREKWRDETGLKFTLYATPAESLTNRFASIDKRRFGIIKDVTDKGYYTNSFHVDVREKIDAFSKFKFEAPFQDMSLGGCISYVEMPNLTGNLEALEVIVRFIYDNIQYAEFNTKSDYCSECGYDGEMKVDEDGQWVCPQCGNKDRATLSVVRRTCGYLGENFWNEGKTKEIEDRVLHI
ncbi:MAG: anaerobic ribonucleoside-triphosphate reductase [Peptoniphilaceae bacterium]|nr:anaerobic ribonucleoside-triphosphate reductase [Peptoniphilaceae bacterium]MDD7383892.1 anaerobic ribonucleoside-triphosphate reductase [Peptoniphilaceae bacterium]MDY3738033.1 anaerobic ribonucleoside-triphosphate reductase [Peptoniphilaceae bacterium]